MLWNKKVMILRFETKKQKERKKTQRKKIIIKRMSKRKNRECSTEIMRTSKSEKREKVKNLQVFKPEEGYLFLMYCHSFQEREKFLEQEKEDLERRTEEVIENEREVYFLFPLPSSLFPLPSLPPPLL